MLQILLPSNIAWYSESFIHISGRKQKLSLSKLKSSILQLNTRYYHNCYIENANKTNCVEFIWKDEYPPNSYDLSPLEYHVWDAMLDMYQCYTPKPTNTYGCEERCASDLSGLLSRPKLIQQYCCSAKGSRHAKSSWWTFRTCCLNRCYYSINMSCFFTIRPSPRPRGSARRKTASSLILRGHF